MQSQYDLVSKWLLKFRFFHLHVKVTIINLKTLLYFLEVTLLMQITFCFWNFQCNEVLQIKQEKGCDLINILHTGTWHIYRGTYADALFVPTSNIFCSSWEKSTGSTSSPEASAQSRALCVSVQERSVSSPLRPYLVSSTLLPKPREMEWRQLRRRPEQMFPREVF